MKSELVGTKMVARALDVSDETIRYHARQGRIPFVLTPGGHRRFIISAVKEALGMKEVNDIVETPGLMIDIDLSEPHREMSEGAIAWLSMSAGKDETTFIHNHEKLRLESPLSSFVKEETSRYAPANTFAGTSLASH